VRFSNKIFEILKDIFQILNILHKTNISIQSQSCIQKFYCALHLLVLISLCVWSLEQICSFHYAFLLFQMEDFWKFCHLVNFVGGGLDGCIFEFVFSVLVLDIISGSIRIFEILCKEIPFSNLLASLRINPECKSLVNSNDLPKQF